MSINVLTLVEMCAHKDGKNLLALKDASGSIPRIMEEAQYLSKRMALLSGDDGTFAPFVGCGGHGVISVVSHFYPRAYVAFYKKLKKAIWR